MSGLIFFSTRELEKIVDFYTTRLGMDIWLEQADCIILKHDNLMLGFCQRQETGKDGMITFYYETEKEVDEAYLRHKDISTTEPKLNEKYNIYHFFATDPEGRDLEFQKFL